MTKDTLSMQEIDDMKSYLDDLRKSGTVNMMQAPQMLMRDFGVTGPQAMAVFKEWAGVN